MTSDTHEPATHPPGLVQTTFGDGEAAEGHPRTGLDARQDEVLKLLEELNERIEAVIREFAPPPAETKAISEQSAGATRSRSAAA